MIQFVSYQNFHCKIIYKYIQDKIWLGIAQQLKFKQYQNVNLLVLLHLDLLINKIGT